MLKKIPTNKINVTKNAVFFFPELQLMTVLFPTQPVITGSKLTIETLEKGMKCFQR